HRQRPVLITMNDQSRFPAEAPAAAPTGARHEAFAAMAAGTSIAFRIVFADGSSAQHTDAPPAFTLIIRNRRAERRIALFGYLGLLESYFKGDVDIDGSLALAFRAGFDSAYDQNKNALVKIRNRWHEFRFSNRSIAQAKANARFHYGLGQAFYKPWLDSKAM